MEQGSPPQLEQVVDDLPRASWSLTATSRDRDVVDLGAEQGGGVQRLRRPRSWTASCRRTRRAQPAALAQRTRDVSHAAPTRAALRSPQFAIGGRSTKPVTGETKRFPGVIEELMLALPWNTRSTSRVTSRAAPNGRELLGLGAPGAAPSPGLRPLRSRFQRDRETLFRPPPFNDLPLTRDDSDRVLLETTRSASADGPTTVD
jgi:hypothetical protein